MRSSTSSSSDPRAAFGTRVALCLRWLARERLLHALGLGLLLLFALAPRGVPSHDLNANRQALLLSQHCADCVWAGDSRIGAALRPEYMSPTLSPPARLVNFSFPLARFTDRYLDAVAGLLTPDSAWHVIVLGVTPHSLTESPSAVDWFERLRSERELDALLGGAVPPPIRIDELPRAFSAVDHAAAPTTGHSDPTDAASVERASRKELAWYRQTFAKLRVQPTAMQRLCTRVAQWTRQGIRVYALRPPTSAEMLAVEEPAGFDQAAFVAQFEAAGGTWIDTAPTAYATSDGSHLTSASAATLSRQVAAILSADRRRTARSD